MNGPILVTGSSGLIGRYIVPRLRRQGHEVREFDIADDKACDLKDPTAVIQALEGVSGVIHLGGISRVVWGQRDPDMCRRTNTVATAAMLEHCSIKRHKPWFVYASSREVYGQPSILPVHEDFELRPMNVYAESKRDSEQHCMRSVQSGLVVNIVRFSSVYGSAADHPDRVVPAFARAAAYGGEIRLEGGEHTLDFTHISDVAEGIERLIAATVRGQQLPPIHLVSGRGVKLGELAELATRLSKSRVSIRDAPPRDYDVSRFIGDPRRASELLGGWRATVSVETGFSDLVKELVTATKRDIAEGSAGNRA